MDLPVLLEKSADGWVLITTDEHRDILAGPFTTEIAARQLAVESKLSIIQSSKKAIYVHSLSTGCLFHLGMYWYRMVKPGKKECIVDVVGQGRQATLAGADRVREISVLSMK